MKHNSDEHFYHISNKIYYILHLDEHFFPYMNDKQSEESFSTGENIDGVLISFLSWLLLFLN